MHWQETRTLLILELRSLPEYEPRCWRVAGVGLYYGEEIHGVPPVLLQMVSRTPVLYEVNIFVTNRFVPIPEVMESERLLVEQLGVSGFYHVIARCTLAPRITFCMPCPHQDLSHGLATCLVHTCMGCSGRYPKTCPIVSWCYRHDTA